MSILRPYFQLDGNASSLLISNHSAYASSTATSAIPSIAWFGDKLAPSIDDYMLASHDNQAHAFASLDARAPMTLFPQAATGYMGAPALVGHFDNAAFASLFTLSNVQHDNTAITLKLVDEENALQVSILIELCSESDVVSIQTSLINNSENNYHIDWLASATIPLAQQLTQCTSQHGRWGLENQSLKRPIGPGRLDIQNLHGRTGHEHGPNIICGEELLNEDAGDATFMHLGWSGNYSLRIERLQDGNGYLQVGVQLSPGELTLKPGEEHICPSAYITSGSGFNQCTQRFHHFARKHILPDWTRTTRPIHANSWEAMYFDLNDSELFSLVDAAAKVGAERFILDDGWFIGRRDDTAGLGDWRVDKTVFPNGLAPLVEHVRSHNMQFGLWFEPEMVNPDSELYRQHPEWALHYKHIETPLARNQLVLDVARDDVSSYLFQCISDLVSEYKIDYIKWDMNRDLVLAGDGVSPRASQQVPAVYRLMQRLTEAHPALEIESCSSGGARSDFGVLKHTGRVWTSDNIDPIARASIQQGFARFFPPEVMGAHVGHEKAHLTGRKTDIHTRAIVALQGQYGFEIDARVLDDEEINTLRHYTALYKQHRHWLSDARYWQLPSPDATLIASGQVAQDETEALYNIVLCESLKQTRPGYLRLRGLNPHKKYTVSLCSDNLTQLKPFNRVLPDWCSKPFVSTGDLLMKIGLPLPVMPPQSALLVHCCIKAS